MEESQKHKYTYPEQTIFSDKMKERFNRLNLPGFDGIKCGDILHQHFARNMDTRFTLLIFFSSLIRVIMRTFFIKQKYRYTGNPDTLFLMSSIWYKNRKDLIASFNNVANLVNNKLLIELSDSNTFLGLQMVKHMRLPLQLDKALRKTITDYKCRWFYISLLYSIFINYKYFEAICRKHNFVINNLVTNCDIDDKNYYYVSVFNKHKKTTVALQHGVFSSCYYAENLIESKSKYFFAHNQYCIDEGLKAGYKGGQMIITGMPSYVTMRPVAPVAEYKKEKIGFVFDGELFHENNHNAIGMLQNYAKRKGIKLYFKLHPSETINDYKDDLDFDVIEKCYTTEISLIDFAKEIDVAIISNSSALSEILSLKKPCFIIYNKSLVDIYSNAPSFRFSTEEELEHLINSINCPAFVKDMEKMNSYFCWPNNTATNYIKAFNSLGIF